MTARLNPVRAGGAVLAYVCFGAAAAACGVGFSSDDCRETRTCAPKAAVGSGGDGGQAGEAETSGAGDHAAPGGAGERSGGGASGDASAPPECPAGYQDWLTSRFAVFDGEIIGTPDFPSMPWVSDGALRIDSGRLSGTGTAVTSQVAPLPYNGTRLRFRVRFSDAEQAVTFAINAAVDGAGGLGVTVSSSGELILTEGESQLGAATFDPLDTGTDWFVEATLEPPIALVTLSAGNYGKASSVIATIRTNELEQVAVGAKAAVRLGSEGGLLPAVDELTASRCAVMPPDYEALLRDTFDRADSATVGSPEVPAAEAWEAGANVRLIDGTLEVKGLSSAAIPVKLPSDGLRIRTAVKMVGGGGKPYLWATVNYNVLADANGSSLPGYWIWGPPNGGYFHTTIFNGPAGGIKHPISLAPDVLYFAQLDRDGDVAVLTVRTQSFAGPLIAVEETRGLSAMPQPGGYFTVSDEGGDGIRFDEISVDAYPME